MEHRLFMPLAALGVAGAFMVAAPSAHSADIYGTITFTGTPPPEINIVPLKNDPTCGPMHKEMPTTHFYVVGPHGGLADVVVALKGVHGTSTGPEAKPLVIEQKGCLYHPYVSACQTGQKIIARNLDPVLHNVHVTPTNPLNPEENRAQLPHGPDLNFTFKAPENFIVFKCDVHPWMFAFVSVFPDPYFSVSDAAGSYRIHNVPPGHYTVVAMHHKAGTEERAVDVGSQDVKLDFTFAAKAVS
jgi:hypothetical protein